MNYNLQGDYGGQRLRFVDFIFEDPQSWLCHICPIPISTSRIGQTVEEPKRSQQILVPDHHGHPVWHFPGG